ncbi:MAG: Uma2 family endonuclease [Acidobacteriota bacterium]
MAQRTDSSAAVVLPEELRRSILDALLKGGRPPDMTYEEFLDWAGEDSRTEWVRGEVIMNSPAGLEHQQIVQFLSSVLTAYAQVHHAGEVLVAPFQMKLVDVGREPDVLFVAAAHMDRLNPSYLQGPADVVVEVMSKESAGRDRGDKFYEYECGGVREYWLIDPGRKEVEFYELDERGHYRASPVDAEGVYHSRVLPGFRLKVDWLWQRPPMLVACRELGLI